MIDRGEKTDSRATDVVQTGRMDGLETGVKQHKGTTLLLSVEGRGENFGTSGVETIFGRGSSNRPKEPGADSAKG